MTQSTADPCLYISSSKTEYLLIWVDDIIIATHSDSRIHDIKVLLSSHFDMKDLGMLAVFLGIQFKHGVDFISMSQSTYLQNVLHTFGMSDCKPRATPCESLNTYDEMKVVVGSNTDYRKMVGSLIYAMTCTRPDLAFVVTKLSQHLSNPEASDWAMLKHVFQYIKGTLTNSLTFKQSAGGIRIYA